MMSRRPGYRLRPIDRRRRRGLPRPRGYLEAAGWLDETRIGLSGWLSLRAPASTEIVLRLEGWQLRASPRRFVYERADLGPPGGLGHLLIVPCRDPRAAVEQLLRAVEISLDSVRYRWIGGDRLNLRPDLVRRWLEILPPLAPATVQAMEDFLFSTADPRDPVGLRNRQPFHQILRPRSERLGGRPRRGRPAVERPPKPRRATIVIPTRNPGGELAAVVERIGEQEGVAEPEVLLLDSGSTDASLEPWRRGAAAAGVRVVDLPPAAFNHGRARARGVEEAAAASDVVVFLSQDALPADRRWLRELLAPFADPGVAGAYCRQLPRPDAPPWIVRRLRSWSAGQEEPRQQLVDRRSAFERASARERLAVAAFDNVAAAVRRDVARAIPFRACVVAEDLDWGHRAVLAGHRIVYAAASKVVHSHHRSFWYELKRTYLVHQQLARILDFRSPVSPSHLLPPPRLTGSLLTRSGRASFLFYLSQNLGQLLGDGSERGLREHRRAYRLIDSVLRRGV